MWANRAVLAYLAARFARAALFRFAGASVVVALVAVTAAGAALTALTAWPALALNGTVAPGSSAYVILAPRAAATTTSLVASPNPAPPGATVTLTATVSTSDGTTPHGSVQFAAGGTLIAAAVHVGVGGVATTRTTFSPGATQALSASFLPATASHGTSTAAIAETVAPATTPTAGTEPLALAVPALGIFTVSVVPGTVSLAESASAAAPTQRFMVSDTRNGYPGWSVSGQMSALTGFGAAAHHALSGNQLGWIPFDAGTLTDAELGPPVAPAAPGLGTKAASLAVAPAGHGYGTYVLFAELILHIPRSAPAGPYSGTLTITYVERGP